MNDQLETKSKAAFSRLRQTELSPSPFMKTRIMARLEDSGKKKSREVVIWRWISAFAVTACAVLAWMQLSQQPIDGARVFAMQPYVIHLDLGDASSTGASIAEIELPEGVHFVSKAHPELAALRSMRMNLPAEVEGRSRLPFVVRADQPGKQDLKLRILDGNQNVVQERIVSVTFTTKSANVL